MRSIKIPFRFDGGHVGYTTDPATIAEQKITNVLITNNGERVMNPNYGASTGRLLFDITAPIEFADYKVDTMQELRRSVTGADVLDLRVDSSFYSQTGEPTTATIHAIYKLPLGAIQAASINIAVPGQITEDSLLEGSTSYGI